MKQSTLQKKWKAAKTKAAYMSAFDGIFAKNASLKYVSVYELIDNNDKRLRKIMRNLIANKGTFKP